MDLHLRAKKLARAAECLIYFLAPDGARPGFRRQNEPKSLELWGFWRHLGPKAWKGAFTAMGFLLAFSSRMGAQESGARSFSFDTFDGEVTCCAALLAAPTDAQQEAGTDC